jgi:rare lipoprotein A
VGGDPRKLTGTFRPYSIQGKTYFPMITANGYSEQGIASWYGNPFHGRATSCGETYDMFQMTAAHKLLPMQTMVRVTNLDNGRSLVVRVNDRGPFVAGRIIDLSYAAALQLGSANKGTAPVLVETLGGVPGATDGNLPGLFYVQVGAFQVKDNAEALLARIRTQGYAQSRIQYAEVGGERFWRVQAGTFNGLATAKDAHGKLLRLYPSSFILAD